LPRCLPPREKKLLDQFDESGLIGTHTIILLGRSGQRITTFLTETGRNLLEIPAPKGIGGPEHAAYQHEFAFTLKELGCKVFIERSVKGKSADIVVVNRTSEGEVQYIAIEIECTTDAISNIKKDLAAGFSQVVLILSGESAIKGIDGILGSLSKEDRARVLVTTPETFLREFTKKMEVKQA